MARLEALFIDPQTKLRHSWCYDLPVGESVRVGRDPRQADWVMEADETISGFHLTVCWDGQALEVVENPQKRPTNRAAYRGQESAQFRVAVGESFVIGRTALTVRPDAEAAPSAPAAPTPAYERTIGYDDLNAATVAHPTAAVTTRTLEDVARAMRLTRMEGATRQQLLKALLDALPWADGVGVVALAETEGVRGRVEVRENLLRDRGTVSDEAEGRLMPSTTLVAKALSEKKSCLYIWRQGVSRSVAVSEYLTRTPHVGEGTPWAVCTPLPLVPNHALYVGGIMPEGPGASSDPGDRLTECQKLAQAFAHLLDARGKGYRQEAQIRLLRDFCPKPLQPFLDDLGRLDELLRPQVIEATVLFCDLRGFTTRTEQGGASLLETWELLQEPVHEMSSAITLHDGVVAGFQGDAVLGFWDWPGGTKAVDQVRQAARAAVRIHAVITKWLEGFHCGIGMAHGPVVAGRLGALDLAKVDVFGPTANLASRLEGLTKMYGVPILVDGAVAETLRADELPRLRTRRLGRLIPKGMTAAVDVAELLTESAAADFDPAHRAAWEEGVDWLFAGRWADAYERLTCEFSDEPAAKFLLGHFGPNGPATGKWHPELRAIRMTEK